MQTAPSWCLATRSMLLPLLVHLPAWAGHRQGRSLRFSPQVALWVWVTGKWETKCEIYEQLENKCTSHKRNMRPGTVQGCTSVPECHQKASPPEPGLQPELRHNLAICFLKLKNKQTTNQTNKKFINPFRGRETGVSASGVSCTL